MWWKILLFGFFSPGLWFKNNINCVRWGKALRGWLKMPTQMPLPQEGGIFQNCFWSSAKLFLICPPPPKSWGCDPSPGETPNKPRKLTLFSKSFLPLTKTPNSPLPGLFPIHLAPTTGGAISLVGNRDKREGTLGKRKTSIPYFPFLLVWGMGRVRSPSLNIPPSFSHPGIDI